MSYLMLETSNMYSKKPGILADALEILNSLPNNVVPADSLSILSSLCFLYVATLQCTLRFAFIPL